MKTLLLLLLLLYPLTAAAETYQWIDERGTANFAEDLGKVPKKYRKKAKRLGAEEETAPAATGSAADPQTARPKGEPARAENRPIGGKDEAGWRREFLQANSNLQSAETELSTLRGRLGDTSKMSRAEYLAIQNSIKHAEVRVQEQQKRLDQLREKADSLGVPAGYRQ